MPMMAMPCQKIFEKAAKKFGAAPRGLLEVIIGGRDVGEAVVDDKRVALVSATGSTRMGREVGPRVAARFGRSLLELGGNNAMIVGPSADLEMAVRAITFSAVGTAGQRFTTLRHVIVHRSIRCQVLPHFKQIYCKLP